MPLLSRRRPDIGCLLGNAHVRVIYILQFHRYVFSGMDDTEGERTLEPIHNFHGIVKFEVSKVVTDSITEPTTGWELVQPLAETFTFTTQIADGT